MHNKFIFQDIDIKSISSYLKDKEWICTYTTETMNVWHRNELKYDFYEILQPLNKAILGYDQRIFELIDVLSEFEKRERNYIFEDLKNYNFDIFKIRVIGSDLNEGYININDGVLLFEKVKLLIQSILHSSILKKGYYTTSIPSRFEDYYNSLKFGQTEHGSYVINVLAPHFDQDQLDSFNNSLTTNITENLNRSLKALSKAIEKFENKKVLTVFQESINEGVNANLCDSLIGISGQKNNHSIEISVSSKKNEQLRIYKFNERNIEIIKKAAEYLRGNLFIVNYNVIGTVVNLKQQYEENIGVVTIKFQYENKIRNIKINLENDEYIQAIKAHANKLNVSIIGDLSISGKNATLLNYKKFSTTEQCDLKL